MISSSSAMAQAPKREWFATVMVGNRQNHYAASDMHRVKADRKELQTATCCQIVQPAAFSGWCMSRALWRKVWPAIALMALIPSGAGAEYLQRAPGARVIAAGGHCDKPPDELRPAPAAKDGYIEHHEGEYVFAVDGDTFPARKGLGVGVRVVVDGYGPGSALTVRTWSAHDGPSTWDVRVDPDGQVEFGTLPSDGHALLPGRYLLSVLSGDRALLTFAFTVQDELEDGICIPAVS
jgi:hypothetical protein